MTIYRKVLCSERLPDKSNWYYTQKGMVYFDSIQGSFYDSAQFAGKNEYWLEEIELPSEEILDALDYNGGFKDGVKWLMEKIGGGFED